TKERQTELLITHQSLQPKHIISTHTRTRDPILSVKKTHRSPSPPPLLKETLKTTQFHPGMTSLRPGSLSDGRIRGGGGRRTRRERRRRDSG
ncbi:unnamed protein product, partial [Musa acuminata subsp. malaccensis]